MTYGEWDDTEVNEFVLSVYKASNFEDVFTNDEIAHTRKLSYDSFYFQLAWHQTEHTLRGLHCGREYHMYVILNNALGASPASKVIETVELFI